MTMKKYGEKRNFAVTSEPRGEIRAGTESKTEAKSANSSLLYVVQKHRATQLHYDFRLEHDGVLLSWAVPKGPSLDPSVKRLAMQVEDHPIEYANFEGTIPKGEYGGGTVMVWDIGTWTPAQGDVGAALEKGDFKFTLHGKKLHGSWVLVRTRGFGGSGKTSWLLIKHRDQYASSEDITLKQPRSAISGKLLAQIAADSGGDVDEAATGDPGASKVVEKRAKRPAPRPKRNIQI